MAGRHGYVLAALLLAMAGTTYCWPVATGGGKLLVLLLDGVRWDFMQEPGIQLPAFTRIAAAGVRAEKMTSIYPSTSYPNYYSIMTGLYAEDHGMVSNNMYDAERRESFDIGTNPDQFHANWWDDGDPLWVTAARQGKKTVMYHWLGCEVEIRGFRPDYCDIYRSDLGLQDFRWALNESLSALANGTADFAGVYYEEPDKAGHKYGSSTQEVNKVMMDIDQSLATLLDRMEATGLSKSLDVIIVSDHGMTSISPSRVINTTTVLSPDDYVMIKDNAALMALWPAPGKLDQVYEKLRTLEHVTVYRKEEIPPEWHFGDHKLVPPIYLVADFSWTIVTPDQPSFPAYRGMHGYTNDHSEMGAIFFAFGPSFKQGLTVPPFVNVELYQVMCHVLGVQPALHDGSWQHVQGMLTGHPTSAAPPSVHPPSTHAACLLLGCQLMVPILWTSIMALLG